MRRLCCIQGLDNGGLDSGSGHGDEGRAGLEGNRKVRLSDAWAVGMSGRRPARLLVWLIGEW